MFTTWHAGAAFASAMVLAAALSVTVSAAGCGRFRCRKDQQARSP